MTCANMLPIWIIKIKITMKIMFTRFEWLANKLCEMGPWSHSGGLRNMDPGLLFTNRFQADYWNLVRIVFVLTFILMIQSVHYFAHVTTAQLSWHVQRHDRYDHYFSFKSYMYHVYLHGSDYELMTYLSSYPWYFQEPHWFSMGLLEISRVTWQVCNNLFVKWLPVFPGTK